MRRRSFPWSAWMLVVVPLVLDCGVILGVDDVSQKRPAPRDAGSTTPGDDDDDGTSGNPSPKDTGATNKVCNGNLDCTRTVFVTKQAFNGDLGGIQGADDKCNAAAKLITSLSGKTFRAWISDATTPADSHQPHGTGAYVRIDKTVVAKDYKDLTDGTLENEISLDEEGNPLPNTDLERSAWTGTIRDGLADPFTCVQWRSASAVETGLFGDSLAKDLNWTERNPSSCDRTRHLYCIEF